MMTNSFNSAVLLNAEQADGTSYILFFKKFSKERAINKVTEGNKLVKAISAERNYNLRDYESSFAMKKMIT